MSADAAVLLFRVLIIATDLAPAIIEAIHARFTHLQIIEATTATALATAIMDDPYNAICLQYPPPWMSTPSIPVMLTQWLPACPILLFAPQDQVRILHRLVDVAAHYDWGKIT